MRKYSSNLLSRSRQLRQQMTRAERHLWQQLRGKQVCGLRFRRQRPIGPFILDFYCPAARLAIEVDGGQHFEPEGLIKDRQRDQWLSANHIKVLRFNNLQVLQQTDDVMEVIWNTIRERQRHHSPCD